MSTSAGGRAVSKGAPLSLDSTSICATTYSSKFNFLSLFMSAIALQKKNVKNDYSLSKKENISTAKYPSITTTTTASYQILASSVVGRPEGKNK